MSEVQGGDAVRPGDDIGGGQHRGTPEGLPFVPDDPPDAGGPGESAVGGEDGGDPAWEFFRQDAKSLGYTHTSKGPCGCGKHWDDYCRDFGIIGRRQLSAIRTHELQWDMERE